MLLNSLRATRVTTDAAVIALALHTGGIGVHDLVIAPSMLTVTSLLAESAIGSYMHNVEADLKTKSVEPGQTGVVHRGAARQIVDFAETIVSV